MLLTGQYPLTHGVFVNDVPLGTKAVSIAQAFGQAGYHTGYIGKWHVDGRGREAFIPPERLQGFRFWQVLECTHDYNRSPFYDQDDATKRQWEGYDAIAQTRAAQGYIREHARSGPFLLMLSWGPPHNPYGTAPASFRELYRPEQMTLRPNVPKEKAAPARKDLAGYYAHCSALDECLGQLRGTLRESGIARDTILVFTSDHGDMLRSHGLWDKQVPYDESVRVPFLLHWPALPEARKEVTVPFSTPDIMPTLLGLAGVPIPATVEGLDFSGHLRGGPPPGDGAALIASYAIFGNWKNQGGACEYRGVRTARHTYVRTLQGPWLLFDNQADPFQLTNLCGTPAAAVVQQDLEARLARKLQDTQDRFETSQALIERFGWWAYSATPRKKKP
jgi:arylsulfatase A-like enzyme